VHVDFLFFLPAMVNKVEYKAPFYENAPLIRSEWHVLSLVHTSNNVEATLDIVEATFDFVAKNGNSV